MPTVRFTAYGVPVGKPRMTQSDKWKQRPEVLRYRAWCDILRTAATGKPGQKLEGKVLETRTVFYLPIPKSWSGKAKLRVAGMPHSSRPDGDNMKKAVWDGLFAEDSTIWKGSFEKYYDDGKGPRAEIELVLE